MLVIALAIYQSHKISSRGDLYRIRYLVYFGIALATLFPDWIWRNCTEVFSMARSQTSSRFMMLCQRLRSLLIFLENACHRSSYIPITQHIDSRGFVSYAISCWFSFQEINLYFERHIYVALGGFIWGGGGYNLELNKYNFMYYYLVICYSWAKTDFYYFNCMFLFWSVSSKHAPYSNSHIVCIM
jgi:hypothetical protein